MPKLSLTCRNSNILSIPFRRTHTALLSEALKQYISKKYDQHPDMFKHDLEAIDQLRSDAVTSLEAHTSGIRKLAGYAAQLVWIGGKFPIDVSLSVGKPRRQAVLRVLAKQNDC